MSVLTLFDTNSFIPRAVAVQSPTISPTTEIIVTTGSEVDAVLTITSLLGNAPTVNAPFILTALGGDSYRLTSLGLTASDTATIEADNLVSPATTESITVTVQGGTVTFPSSTVNIVTGGTLNTTVTVTNRNGGTPTVNAPFILTFVSGDTYQLTSPVLTASDTAVVEMDNGVDPVFTGSVNVNVVSAGSANLGSYRGGWQLLLDDGTGFNVQLKITEISGLGQERPPLRVTCFDSPVEEYIAGFQDGSELAISAHLLLDDPEQTAYLNRIEAGQTGNIRLTTTNNLETLSFDFTGLYLGWTVTPSFDSANGIDIKIKITSTIERAYT